MSPSMIVCATRDGYAAREMAGAGPVIRVMARLLLCRGPELQLATHGSSGIGAGETRCEGG